MRAIVYDRFGPAAEALSLTDMPSPEPAAGEVLVDLAFSGVNPSDVKARGGTRPGVTKPAFAQIIPQSDGAGTISAVGAGVDPARIGQPVWIWNGQWQRAFGTCAEQIALPSDQAVKLPDGVDMQTGASLGIPGLTACHAVFGGGDIRGKTVLVQGGAGTVGLLSVQLARWGGAHVIATARGEGAEHARAAGAAEVVDFTDAGLVEKVLAANNGNPVDRIIEPEFGINIAADIALIAQNGTIAAYGSAAQPKTDFNFLELMFKAATVDAILIYLLPLVERHHIITRLHDALTEGALTIPVEQVFALSETAAAHEAVEKGARHGAILVEVGK
ncbi:MULTISPECIES: NADPH:quinone reductase [Roseobacteraceae]|uniref:Quinone oxidoreductase 1 n=1 Tax=Pseudosulfitobacter pseudonitzschiae TaxID=1402135 RepID=A0A221JWZ0_9RHOB|nr:MULTISPECIES: NADPH:quinone reductase [Roseobacteraceae]ASM71117.1 quinone oxidoreductase 1 [Pseudosulfitobacter pseudonitzschiae]